MQAFPAVGEHIPVRVVGKALLPGPAARRVGIDESYHPVACVAERQVVLQAAGTVTLQGGDVAVETRRTDVPSQEGMLS